MGQFVRNVVITGASAGLGRALALLYAEQGRTLGLLGRNQERLAAVAVKCRAKGADVVLGTPDVTNFQALAGWMQNFATEHPIDLLIVNAGAFTGNGPDGVLETLEQMSLMLRTNLEGATNTVAAALPQMRARRTGRIAVVGSLAALHPLADAPAYSASKAGLMGYGEALRECLLPDNVAVSLIYPGHIRTAQVARHIGALPLIMSPEQAAIVIKDGLDRGLSFIAFPKRLLWLIRAGRLVPWRVRALLGAGTRFHVSGNMVGEPERKTTAPTG